VSVEAIWLHNHEMKFQLRTQWQIVD
jgi:hypothetical protein